MMFTSWRHTLAVASFFLVPTTVSASDAVGTWLVAERDARVRISPCGSSLCGWISWMKGPASFAKVGQRVLWDMKAQGDGVWTGKAFDPRDGNTYSGKLSVSGDGLTMTGCVAGGLICRSQSWARVK